MSTGPWYNNSQFFVLNVDMGIDFVDLLYRRIGSSLYCFNIFIFTMWGLGLPKYLCLDAKRPFPGSFKLGGSREHRNIVITTSFIFAQPAMY